jgi:hypothetical protein
VSDRPLPFPLLFCITHTTTDEITNLPTGQSPSYIFFFFFFFFFFLLSQFVLQLRGDVICSPKEKKRATALNDFFFHPSKLFNYLPHRICILQKHI